MKKSLGTKTLLYPAPVLVVGTYDADGRPNVMTASWGGICCSDPPCIAISLRKATYTYENITKHRAFTISIPSTNYVKEIDHFGIVSGRTEDKFAATGLTAVRGDRVDAPYVGEFPIVLECQLLDTVEIGLHTQFIGEILDVKAEDAVMALTGFPDMKKVNPLIFEPGVRSYYSVGDYLGKAFHIGRLR